MRPIDADAALKALRKCQTYLYDTRDPELKIELSSAEAAINNLPTIQPEVLACGSGELVAQPEPCGDTISRQAAIDELRKFKPEIIPYEKARTYVEETVKTMYDRIVELPTVQPEVRTGKWTLGFDNRYMEKYYYCSRCGCRKYGEHEPLDYFCSNCGADMRGGQDGH